MSQINVVQKTILLTLLVIFGALAIITFNLQNSQIVYINSEDTYGTFNHPFMQTLTMFIAEFICLFLFFYVKTTKGYQEQKEASEQLGQRRISIFLILVPTCCDSVGALCIYISLNFLPPSVNSILTCGIIATSAILSRIILKRKYSNQEIQGCILVLVGVAVVGLSGFLFPEETQQEDLNKQIVSIFLMCISILLYGFQYTIEEKFYKTYYLHQLELVGYEGMWGLIIYSVICTVLTFTQCPEVLQGVCIERNGQYYFERVDYYFQQFAQSGLLQFAVILGILSISVYNTMCQTVTKYLSCVTRALVDVAKIMLIWIISLIISLNTQSPNYHWENTRLGAIIIEALGFVLVVIGEIIYNFYGSQVADVESNAFLSVQ